LTAWEQLTGGYTAYSLNTIFNHNSKEYYEKKRDIGLCPFSAAADRLIEHHAYAWNILGRVSVIFKPHQFIIGT
jgi:hypothetical protein